jgi:glycosyltransferase involved in cell wall biosynthesis
MTDRSGHADKRLRLAFVCAGNPSDLRTWSGTPSHMLEALRPHFDIVDVVHQPFPGWFVFLRRVLRRLSGGAIDVVWSQFWASLVSARIVRDLEKSDCDYVFAVAVTPIAAHLVSVKPTVFVSDATQSLMSNYNPMHSNLTPGLKKSAKALENRSISGAALCLFPSNWARSSAIADHGANPADTVAVPWGANLITDEISPPEMRSVDNWKLLFVGTDWQGKGGDIALATVAKMREQGRKVEIDIVGSTPATPPPSIDGVSFHGFLNKNNAKDRARLNGLFRSADVFFLPTQFEALGIVFAEAASYAIPSVTYDTGGISGMVVDQVTGVLLKEGESADAFCRAITDLLTDRERYLRMCDAALQRSRMMLNWEAWAERVAGELKARRAAVRENASQEA